MSKTKNETNQPVAAAAPPDPQPEAAPGRLIVLLGRGRTGKTTEARWAADRAIQAGRPVILADGDRTNRSLSAFYPGTVLSPPDGSDAAVSAWLEQVAEQAVEERATVILDVGGGDTAFRTKAAELEWARSLPALGLGLVVQYFVAGGVEDAAALILMESLGIQAEKTMLVLNHGLAPAIAGADPFAATLARKEVQAVLDRQARVVRMPALRPDVAVACDALRISHREAAQGLVPLGPDGQPRAGRHPLKLFDRQRVQIWLREMEEAHREVADWLP